MAKALSWALTIATYNRRHILPRCLELGATQSWPPQQIVVVDSSDDWEVTRDLIMTDLAPHYPAIEWIYEPAKLRGSAPQRNQAARRAQTDIVFLIDDDSLMYPTCAEAIMTVYTADTQGKIVGVSAMSADRDPSEGKTPDTDVTEEAYRSSPTTGSSPTAAVKVKKTTGLKQVVRQWLRSDDRFVPYDEDFPRYPLPPEVQSLKVGWPRLMGGYAMTWRRDIVLKEPFEERMKRYGAGEDSDMSYRASRHGALAKAFDAWLFHAEASGGRLSPYTVTALGVLNPLMMHRLYSSDRQRSKSRNRALLRRRLVIEGLKDLESRSWTLPRARGILFGLQQLDRILDAPDEVIDSMYETLQDQLLTPPRSA